MTVGHPSGSARRPGATTRPTASATTVARSRRRAAAPVPPEPTSPAPAGAGAASVDQILATLRASGCRITSGRRAVVEALLASGDRHVSAEEIIATVQRRLPEVAESSIYRTLSALEGVAVVTHVHLGHGPATFHLGVDSHRHLVCRLCHAIVDIPADSMTAFAADIEQRYGFVITDEHFALTGECLACRPPAG